MIKKLIKVLSNPQGALVQAVIGLLVKQFNLDKVEEKIAKALKYVDEPNELDIVWNSLKNMVKADDKKIN